MSTVKGLRAGAVAFVLVGMTLAAATVGADDRFNTERPSSVEIFPKVVNTSGTIIQLTNTSNMLINVHCFYINGQEIGGAPVWQVTDFALVLTRQQPTHWEVGTGRPVSPNDATTGLDPGLIPPVPPGFVGSLVCVEVLPSGEPSAANSLIGNATVGQVTGLGGANGVSKYNGIGIQACPGNGECCDGTMNADCNLDTDNVLELNDEEFAACPGGLLVNFAFEGAPDAAIDGSGNTPSVVSTNWSLVPCGFDFENFIPTSTFLTFNGHDEFEAPLSVSSVPIDCYFSADLGDPVFGNQLTFGFVTGSTYATGILRPQAPGDLPALGVENVLRTAGDGSSDTAATNMHFCTEAGSPSDCDKVDSEIRLPNFE